MSKSLINWLQSFLSIAIAFMLISSIAVSHVSAQETEEQTEEEKKDDEKKEEDPFAIPEGATPAELVDFIKGAQKARIRTRAEFDKRNEAVRKAAEMILAGEAEVDATEFASEVLLSLDLSQMPMLKFEQQKELFEKVKKLVTDADKIEAKQASMMQNVARGLEYARNPKAKELAKTAYKEFGALMASSENEAIAQSGRRMEGVVRRLELVGKPFELTGTRFDGSEFDISELKGKVVLIDFWATWCGPCIAEHPNIKKNYEKYHEKGFEVVGISLDRNREALEKFVEEHKTKWITLHEEGGKSPAADHYGVMGIPTMILVGKDGNVLSIAARGATLTKLLEKEFGEDDTEDSDQPK